MAITTNNYKLTQLELTNAANFPLLLNDTFKTIDKGLTLDVGTSTGTGNNYVLNLGSITLTSANKGISFKFWSDKNASGAVKINGTYNLVKANGSSVTNLKAGAPYTITYDGGTNFFLASGGGVDDVNFTSDKLLTGYSANDSNGEKIDGTMPDQGAKTATLNCGGSYTIPKGYHNGSGKVTANSLSSQTSANATAKDIIKGKTAWVNGSKITGTATIQSLGGKKFYNNTIDVTIPKNTTTFNVNIGFAPTTVILRILTPSGAEANNWIFARSTDITWLTHAWKNYASSSSSSYTPTTQIDSLTNTGFIYRVNQDGSPNSKDKSYKFHIFAIG